jgi:agmatinase
LRDASSILRPVSAYHKLAPLQHIRAIDYGDVQVVKGALLRTYEEMEKTLAPLVQSGIIPICLGGDHSITLAELRVAAQEHGPVALLQFDSHTDVYDVYHGTERYNSGTMFRRAVEEGIVDTEHSMMVGLRGTVYSTHDYEDAVDLGYSIRTMEDVVARGIPAIIDDIRDRVDSRPLFVTFDIDCLDPAYAPGTGALEIGGFTTREILQIIRALQGLNFVGFDIVEVNPTLDPTRATAAAGVTIAFEFLTLVALARADVTSRESTQVRE